MLEGKDALKEKYRERLQILKVHADIQNRMVIGNKVFDYEYITSINTDTIIKAVAIYEVEVGLIKKVWFVFK